MLSKAEREYLVKLNEKLVWKHNHLKTAKMVKNGKNKPKTPKTPTERNDLVSIRRKTVQAMRDLTLVFDTLSPSELKFYQTEYKDIATPLLSKISLFAVNAWFYQNIQNANLAIALEIAGKRPDIKRLMTDEKYKQRMIDWCHKNNVETFSLPPLDSQKKQRYEYLRELTGESAITATATPTG